MCIGLAITIYIRCICSIFSREITIHMVIYGVYIRFWPTLNMQVWNTQHCTAKIQPVCRKPADGCVVQRGVRKCGM